MNSRRLSAITLLALLAGACSARARNGEDAPATALASGPVRIAGGASQTFTWTCAATTQGQHVMGVTVTAADVSAGTSVPASIPGVDIMVMRIVHRWWNATVGDHFYTLDPSGEEAPRAGYQGQGQKFRTYPTGAAGTTPFLRFWNGRASDHFYTAAPDGEGAERLGYQREGDIGNIGTSPLPGSVALHRYWNGTIGDHFYTTDFGDMEASGYQYESIAGYVLPCE